MSSTQPRYPTSLRVAFVPGEGAPSARATNISAGGMFVHTERKLSRGALLSVALELPDGPAPVQAKVIHDVAPARRRTSPDEHGVGVQFVGTDDAFRDRLERYIESLLARSKVPVRVLLIARDLLHEKGWTQLTARDPAGSYCLTGALSKAAGGDRDAYRAALQSMGPRLSVPACAFGGFNCHCAVLSWNDREGRTKNEAIAKLDEVISPNAARIWIAATFDLLHWWAYAVKVFVRRLLGGRAVANVRADTLRARSADVAARERRAARDSPDVLALARRAGGRPGTRDERAPRAAERRAA